MSLQQASRNAWSDVGGRYLIRLRETHLRDHIAPLLSGGAAGAAKLDIVLRGLAAYGGERPGVVPPEVSWSALHDLVRDPDFYGEDMALKRDWIGDKLSRLEQLGLITRTPGQHGRPTITVLRDDASGQHFDDPDGQPGNSYVTVLGTVIGFGRLRHWGAPEVAAFLASMIAERYARSEPGLSFLQDRPFGGGLWYRPLWWFADREGLRPEGHVRVPFSGRTLRRGLASLKQEGLIDTERIGTDPRTGRPFAGGPRVLYHNGFDDVRPGRRINIARGANLDGDPRTMAPLPVDLR